jgi:WD40 repeat protein
MAMMIHQYVPKAVQDDAPPGRRAGSPAPGGATSPHATPQAPGLRCSSEAADPAAAPPGAWDLHHTNQAEEALRIALPDLQAVRTFQDGTTVYSAAFDPVDVNKVASADAYGMAWIWDVKTGHRLVRMSLGGFGATGTADAVAFNPAGTQVVVGYADGQVALFDARSGRKLESVTVTGSPIVNGVTFIDDIGALAIAAQNGAYLWLPGHGSPLPMLPAGHNVLSKGATSIAADPDNPLEYAVATSNGTVIVELRQSDGSVMRVQSLNQGQPAGTADADAEFSRDGSQVVTADGDGKVRVYNVATGKTVMTLDAGDADATSVAFSPDGSQIAAGYSSGMTRVWGVSTRLQLTQLAGHAAWIEAVRFSPDSSKVVTTSADGTVRVWYSRPRELQAEFASSYANGVPNRVLGAGYLTRNRIAVLDSNGNLYVFTPGGKRLAAISPSRGAAVYSAATDNAGTDIVTAHADGTVDVWHAVNPDYTTMRRSSTIRVSGVQDVAMSPDGSRFTVVTTDNYYAVQVRNAHTGQLLKTLDAANPVNTVTFSPNGRQIVAADYSGQVEVWDAATGHRRLLGKPGPSISDIEFNTSGSEFVTASAGGTVTVWAAPGDRPLASFDACPSPNEASPSPDGGKIVVACEGGAAPVFDATGRLLTELAATSGGTVSSAGFSFDGKSILTVVDSEGTGDVQVWNAELADPSPSDIARIAKQRTTRQLTPAERSTYLADIGG